MERKPWDLHPALTADRISEVAELICSARKDVLEGNAWLVGDCPWGLGCLMYDASRIAISRASQEATWLGVVDPSLHFVFSINGVPVRFYRGDAEDPNENSLRIRAPERQRSFGFASDGISWYWRLAIETDDKGLVERAVFLQASESGETQNHYDIPLRSLAEKAAVPISSLKREGVKLDAPVVKIKRSPLQAVAKTVNEDDDN